ncbi:hypothetical protein [Actinoplanes couchii]|uniref:ABC transporter substrate-binding protein n=1 Tax=Actinoplanes couchii TaxID=403638 RepID=A0ABQ3XHU1_9ACTN|nr:hypothetical protein [Actinoplanes couchii]MDR6317687.1 TPP-dependent trihydroxycyclohexane-1,2-dione (THcHDO) dehydratase [Actinoplanes couchii]GID58072.1 hypothetical protein Aco03nite_064760 [Actinoplanes couchii]
MRLQRIVTSALAATLALTVTAASGGAAQASPTAHAPAPAAAPAAPTLESEAGSLTSTVSGSFTDALGAPGTVTGTFSPTEFTEDNGKIVAVGTLTSTLTDSLGVDLGTVEKTVSLPVQLPETAAASKAAADALVACDVLNLVLGPLHLDLLGLVVDLNRVVLDVVAQSGAGNLLGNLLCAITNLLNGGISLPLAFLIDLLNQILAILRL